MLNGLTDEVLDAVAAGLPRRRRADDSVRVVVITGAGRGFCSGQDLRGGLGSGDIDIRGHLRNHYVPMIKAMRELEKPVIASVNGVAAGAGMSLALAADFRIAGESATFIQAFVRIGLVPDAGSSYFLPRLVGTAKALELAMLGETVDSAEALRLGLVHRVVPDADLAPRHRGVRGSAGSRAAIRRADQAADPAARSTATSTSSCSARRTRRPSPPRATTSPPASRASSPSTPPSSPGTEGGAAKA